MSFWEQEGTDEVIGIRPHDVLLHQQPVEGIETYPVTLQGTEVLGFESILHLDMEDGFCENFGSCGRRRFQKTKLHAEFSKTHRFSEKNRKRIEKG